MRHFTDGAHGAPVITNSAQTNGDSLKSQSVKAAQIWLRECGRNHRRHWKTRRPVCHGEDPPLLAYWPRNEAPILLVWETLLVFRCVLLLMPEGPGASEATDNARQIPPERR